MLRPDWTGTSEQLWAAAGRPALQNLGATPAAAERILELSQLRGYRRPESMLTMRFIDGVLAIHQAGGYVALLHPFRSVQAGAGGEEMPLFVREEPVLCPSHFRAFPPQEMLDHRHLLFSTPVAVYAIHLWSLRDWNSQQAPEQFHILLDCGAADAPRLACPPLPLDDERIGIISRRADGTYLWSILNLAERLREGPQTGLSEAAVPLPIFGDHCYATSIQDQVLAIATSQGHWVWRHGDARDNKVEELVQTWPRDAEGGRLVPNRQDESSNEFHSLRHYLVYDRSAGAAGLRNFTWFFQRLGRSVNPLECYSVDCATLKPEHALTLDAEWGTVPLGLSSVGSGAASPTRMLFCSGQRLNYESGRSLRPMPGFGTMEDVEQSSGALFCDPVLMVIKGGKTSEGRLLIIRSLRHPTQKMTFQLPHIQAEPLLWSRWLFTVEVEENYSLSLHRRDLQPPVSTG